MRLALESRIAVLTAISDGEPMVRMKVRGKETGALVSASTADRLRAIDLMAKYGLGTQMEVPVSADGAEVERQVVVIGGKEIWF